MIALWQNGDLQVSLAQRREELSLIRPYWDLFADHPRIDPDIFLMKLEKSGGVSNPAILVVHKLQQVCALFIAKIEDKRLNFRIGFLSVAKPRARVLACSDRGFIGAADPQVSDALVAAILYLLRNGAIDYAHFASLDVDSPLRQSAQFLPSKLCRGRLNSLEQRWFLHLPRSYEEFLKSRSRKTRENIKRKEKRLLQECCDTEVRILRGNKFEIVKAFYDIMQIVRKTYQYRLGLTPFSNPSAQDIWNAMSMLGRIVLILVYINKEPVAFSCAQVFKNTAVYLTPGYDPKYTSLSIGQFSLLKLIRYLIEHTAVETLDYGLGYSQYKETLGTRYTLEGHVRIFAPSWKGIYLKFMRTGTQLVSSWALNFLEGLRLKDALKKRLRNQV
jgi:hypothetical protein